MKQKINSLATASILLILLAGIYIQSQLYLSWDVSWHLLITQRFLNGGNYVTAFMDINPPIILYTLIPSIMLSNISGIHSAIALRIVVFTMGILSLFTCYYQIKKCFVKKEHYITAFILVAIAFCFFILPAHEFGQREHLFLIFTLPYFFRVAALSEEKSSSLLESVWIGLLAGIGFLINIEFMLLFSLIEIYLMIKRKSLFMILRTDSILVLLLLSLYIASVFILTPNYIHIILPLVAFLYQNAFNYSWYDLFTNTASFCWLAAAIFFPFHIKRSKHKPLSIILFISITIFILQFLLTRKTWYYHMLPTIAFSMLLLTLYLINDMFEFRYAKNIHINGEIDSHGELYKSKQLIITMLVFASLILLPINTMFIFTRAALIYSNKPNNEINQLIRYTKKQALGKNIFVFSLTVPPAPTLVEYADVSLDSRFAGFWMLPGIVNLSKEKLNKKDQAKLKAAKKLLFQLVSEDFTQNKPNYVFVDVNKYKTYFDDKPFDYIQYFSQDPRFKKAWKNYKYLGRIGFMSIYKNRH